MSGFSQSKTVVISTGNLPPNAPSNPNPYDGKTDVDVNSILGWSGGDPNTDDTVTYDVYFGTDSNPPMITIIGPFDASQNSLTFNPDVLEYSTTYYWKIVARDNTGEENLGDIWSFTTKDKRKGVTLDLSNTHSGSFSFSVKNTGADSIDDVHYNVTIKGVIFGRVDYSKDGDITSLNPGETMSLSLGYSFGLDLVEVKVVVRVDDKTYKTEKTGLLLGRLLIIF